MSTYLEDFKAAPDQKNGDENKKHVFLIGDSIRMGYCERVRKNLEGIAEVYFPEDNCKHSQNIMSSLVYWVSELPREQMNVVQFNCGHWDAAHWMGIDESNTSVEEYGRNVGKIARLLRKYFPNARIVFATTTPMNPSGLQGGNPRTTEEIKAYNCEGKKAAEANGLLIADLFAETENWDESAYADYCHFTPDGFDKLGDIVTENLKKLF